MGVLQRQGHASMTKKGISVSESFFTELFFTEVIRPKQEENPQDSLTS